MKMDKAIKRGDLVYLNFDPIVGSEQGGPRPAVVVQNDMGNKHAPTVIIAPVTSKNKKSNLPTHVKLTSHILERNSMVLLEQLKIVDKSRIDSYSKAMRFRHRWCQNNRLQPCRFSPVHVHICWSCQWTYAQVFWKRF